MWENVIYACILLNCMKNFTLKIFEWTIYLHSFEMKEKMYRYYISQMEIHLHLTWECMKNVTFVFVHISFSFYRKNALGSIVFMYVYVYVFQISQYVSLITKTVLSIFKEVFAYNSSFFFLFRFGDKTTLDQISFLKIYYH